MRPKTIATGLLLAFVVLSISVLVGKELRPGATRPEGVAPPASRIAQAKAGIPAPRVIAYYFHGTARCVTCKKIEAFAREAIGESFPDAIQDGRLEVRSVDYEEPENEHFLEDYRLSSPSLVLVDPRRTGPGSWKILQEVWQLNGDKPAFFAYVKDEVGKFLGTHGG